MSETQTWTSFKAECGCFVASATSKPTGFVTLRFRPESKSKEISVQLTHQQFDETMLCLEDTERFIDAQAAETSND